MKVAILGTRGIPNQYGGFEQFAEYVSVGLVEKGCDVTVYNTHLHKYNKKKYRGVKIITKYSPENRIGSAANFIYDYLCLRDALKKKFDIIYEAGYQSVAISYLLLPIKRSVIVTNMDGLEWKRSKWNSFVKRLTKKFEGIAVRKSHHLISDNEGIRQYFLKEYNKESYLIEYGANPVNNLLPDKTLKKFDIVKRKYFLIIARLEPENNIEMVLDGYRLSEMTLPFIIIGNVNTPYGAYLKNRYAENKQIRFIGAVYDKDQLDILRNSCCYYFHGHSVGGTNPSLLEAMAAQSAIVAHDNPFNRDVLEENAVYFKDSSCITTLLKKTENQFYKEMIENNLLKINNYYTWDNIIKKHITLFNKIV